MVVITLSVILKVYLDTVSGPKLLSHCLEHCCGVILIGLYRHVNIALV